MSTICIIKNKGVIVSNCKFLFGDSLEEFKRQIGEPDWVSPIAQMGTFRVEYSEYESFFGFNKNNIFTFFETYSQKEIKIDSIKISLSEHYNVLIKKLRSLTDDWSENESGIVSSSLGIGFFADGYQKEFEGYFESLSVFPKQT